MLTWFCCIHLIEGERKILLLPAEEGSSSTPNPWLVNGGTSKFFFERRGNDALRIVVLDGAWLS